MRRGCSMKKAALWVTVIALIAFVITWGVMGLKIFDGDYDIEMLVYIGVAAWALLLAGIVVLRWGSWKCPHCGKLRWTKGHFCSYCGKEIK